jgi:hypothetical protein
MRVRLDGVSVSGDDAAESYRRVHLRVQLFLGELTPADVCVTVAPDGQRPSRADDRGAPEQRMASCQSYRNGTYVMEAWLPADALQSAGPWSIRVTRRGFDVASARTLLEERIALSPSSRSSCRSV